MRSSGIHIIGYRPPNGWTIQMWIGEPAHFTCPSCGASTHVLLVPDGELSSENQHCDECVPG